MIPNFESGKICLVDGLFVKGVLKDNMARLGDKWPVRVRNFYTWSVPIRGLSKIISPFRRRGQPKTDLEGG